MACGKIGTRLPIVILSLLILLIGCGIRAIALGQTPRLQRDTIEYLSEAVSLQQVQPPAVKKIRLRQLFYTWILHFFDESAMKTAAVVISMVLGILQIAVLGFLAYELSGRRLVALAVMLLAAVSPALVQISVSGLREPGMLFFGTLGLSISLWSQDCERWIGEIAAGAALLIGAAFRVEGLEMLLIAGAFLGLAMFRRQIGFRDFLKHCAGLGIGGIAAALFFALLAKNYAAWLA